MHKDRDILNLGANLREPSWHRWNPRKPHYNAEEGPKNSNSVHFRLESKTCLTEDYPMVIKITLYFLNFRNSSSSTAKKIMILKLFVCFPFKLLT